MAPNTPTQRPPLAVPIILIVVGALFPLRQLPAGLRSLADSQDLLAAHPHLRRPGQNVGFDARAARTRSGPRALRSARPLPYVAFVCVSRHVALLARARVLHEGLAASSFTEPRKAHRRSSRTPNRSTLRCKRAAGQLNISGGSSHLLDADFDFQ